MWLVPYPWSRLRVLMGREFVKTFLGSEGGQHMTTCRKKRRFWSNPVPHWWPLCTQGGAAARLVEIQELQCFDALMPWCFGFKSAFNQRKFSSALSDIWSDRQSLHQYKTVRPTWSLITQNGKGWRKMLYQGFVLVGVLKVCSTKLCISEMFEKVRNVPNAIEKSNA